MNKYRKLEINYDKVDSFLELCNELDFHIICMSCSDEKILAVYKGRYDIEVGDL